MDIGNLDWDQYEWQDTWAQYDDWSWDYDNGLNSFDADGYYVDENGCYWYQDGWGKWTYDVDYSSPTG